MLKIDGISEVRAEKLGVKFEEAIKEFCDENDLKMNNFASSAPSHIVDKEVCGDQHICEMFQVSSFFWLYGQNVS